MDTRIPIYSVDASGAFKELVGHGTPIAPSLLLVQSPLNGALAARVGTDGTGLAVAAPNVVPVLRVNVAGSEAEPLVALDLAETVQGTYFHVLAGSGRKDPAKALQDHLAGAATLHRISEWPPPHDDAPWCAIWPTAFWCSGNARRPDEP